MSLAERRIYYNDSECLTFEGAVLEQFERDGQWYVRLDRTAFYPTSGGQPYDVGTLDDARVLDVFVDGDEVFHKLDKSVVVGQVVHGQVDWDRRLDHMQHHTGQHILSACFEQLLNVDTVGFHLGEEVVTVDVSTAQLSDDELLRVEAFANEIIWRDLAVTAAFIPDGDLSHYRLRHPPKVSREIRIVSIEGFDDNACGGTHVQRTGQVGQIVIVKTEKMRAGTRVTFLCGGRALKDHQRRVRVLTSVCSQLSASLDDVVGTVDKLQQSLMTARKAESGLREALWRVRAAKYAGEAVTLSDGSAGVCVQVDDAVQANDLKSLATHIAAHFTHQAYFVAIVGQVGDRVHIQVFVSPDCTLTANECVTSVLNPVGGKGGGNKTSAQGSVQCTGLSADNLFETTSVWLLGNGKL